MFHNVMHHGVEIVRHVSHYEHAAHLVYLALVAAQADHGYAYAAAACCVISVVASILKGTSHHA